MVQPISHMCRDKKNKLVIPHLPDASKVILHLTHPRLNKTRGKHTGSREKPLSAKPRLGIPKKAMGWNGKMKKEYGSLITLDILLKKDMKH